LILVAALAALGYPLQHFARLDLRPEADVGGEVDR
jgi:hypothetical protein